MAALYQVYKSESRAASLVVLHGPGYVVTNLLAPLSHKVCQPSPVDITMTSGDARPTDRGKLEKFEISVQL